MARQDLFLEYQDKLLKLAKGPALADLRAELKRLVDLNIIIEQANGSFDTVRRGKRLTASDRYCLKQLNLTLLSQVLFPGWLERSPKTLFVDHPPRRETSLARPHAL